jgi:hypothetical protein
LQLSRSYGSVKLSSQDEFEADILDKHEDLDDVAETLENR